MSNLNLRTVANGSVILSPTSTATDKTITLPATDGTMVVQDGTNTTTVTNLTATGTVNVGGGNISPQTGFKNRIINGGMVIDQRNAGASVTVTNTAAFTYTLDRWAAYGAAASKFSVQQNAGSITPPAGFTNYLGVTSLAATSLSSGDYYVLQQQIEGFNVADLAWGTADSSPVSLSFRVRSSLTGTFSGSLVNGGNNRSYPFTYTIGSANTWTTITITISGDTTGTWLTNNSSGIRVYFSLGTGTTLSGTANTWQAGVFTAATGATSVVGTNGATFYITGVQLEKGSTATPFEFRSIGQELVLCQRYYYKIVGNIWLSAYATTGFSIATIPLGTMMRTTPTVTQTNNQGQAVAGGLYSGNGYMFIYQLQPSNGFELSAFTASAEL